MMDEIGEYGGKRKLSNAVALRVFGKCVFALSVLKETLEFSRSGRIYLRGCSCSGASLFHSPKLKDISAVTFRNKKKTK